jgi:hypothetical protein
MDFPIECIIQADIDRTVTVMDRDLSVSVHPGTGLGPLCRIRVLHPEDPDPGRLVIARV